MKGALQWHARLVLLGWLAGVATCGAAGAVAAWAIVYGGAYDTRASKPHLNVVARAFHHTMISSVKRRAEKSAPVLTTGATVLAGAREYEAHCLACHGGPGVSRAPWAGALLPTPPYLVDARTRWSQGEVRELVFHGVKMTAMPAWGEVLPAGKIDELVAFLWAAPSLTPSQYEQIRRYVRAQPTSAMDAAGPAVSLWPQPLASTQPLDRAVAQPEF